MNKLFSQFRRPKETSTTQLHRLPNMDDTINSLIPPPPSSSLPIHPTQASTSSGHNGMPVQAVELPQQQRTGHRITPTATFGIDHAFKKVSDFLSNNEDVGGVGIYGMGGVGKTTLMRRIHQEFLLPQGFDVIWITVSKTINVDKVQQVIMKEMGLRYDPDEEPYNRAQSISRKLEEEDGRVALLLDDIWEFVDLEEVLGPVDFDPSIFKIVFTTRLKKVCKLMKPHKEIKMKCLGWDDSWALFEKTVGREAIYDCDLRIVEVAKDIAKECKGLPLALIVIGRAMAGMCGVEEWKSALSTLRKSPTEYAERKLFSRLKFSYDMLPTQMAKDCFLHCCSFPEDSYIASEELVELWMGEGLLGLHGSYVETRNKGYEIIGTLEAACLLEKQIRPGVKMHDIIREMGLWVICDDKFNFILDSGISFSQEEIAERWRVARRIFISPKSILPEQPTCSNLLALLQSEPGGVARVSVPNGFFESSQGLRVLDLDGVEFDGLPVAVCSLSELRYLYIRCSNLIRLPEEIRKLSKLMVLRLEDNEDLRELPSTIGQLVELRKLVLNTGPKELPVRFTNLNKLNVLELGRSYDPESCVERFPASFADLEGLRILNLNVTYFSILPAGLWKLTKLENLSIFCDNYPRNQVASVGGLGQLCGIQTLRVTRCPFVSWINLLAALRNMNKLAELYMTSLPIDAIIMLSETRFPYLIELEIRLCAKLEKIHIGELALPNLHKLGIFDCRSLHQIHGFHHLRGLVKLQVTDCLFEELFSEGENFPKLKLLELHRMRKLNIICSDSVMFPSLSKFYLSDCQNLKKLPRGLMNESRSLKICEIWGNQRWLDGLSWQDDEFKSFLQPLLIIVEGISLFIISQRIKYLRTILKRTAG